MNTRTAERHAKVIRTRNKSKSKSKSKTAGVALCAALISGVFFLLLWQSDITVPLVREGIRFSVTRILPSLFPFLILSDLLISLDAFSFPVRLLSPLCRRLRLPKEALPPLLFGWVCGFPVGAGVLRECVAHGKLTKKEADILLPAADNASPAFLIGAVGSGLLGSRRAGFVLWLVPCVTSLLVCLFLLPKNRASDSGAETSRLRKPHANENKTASVGALFVASAKKAARSSLDIGAFVTVFYLICGFLRLSAQKLSLSPVFTAVLCAISELGNGCAYAASLGKTAFPLCGFAAGWGGLCVLCQVKAAAHEDADLRPYLLVRLFCGTITAFFALFLL